MNKGEIYGMIKFGSRTELYLPASKEFEIKVKIDDRVFFGSTIMAEIKKGC
ncbi:MAG: phosphatidylserine decarboxylase [Victivallaceae bacterium]|nr:phosphatidylserine decarboxylase [Victivallaceae bacterium]